MKTSAPLNIYIVDDDKMYSNFLQRQIESVFINKNIHISTFETGELCLEKIKIEKPRLIFMDYLLNGKVKDAKNGIEIIKTIKNSNPEVEVTMLTSNQDQKTYLGAFQAGANGYFFKGKFAQEKIVRLVDRLIAQPILALIGEYEIQEYIFLFFITFISIGIIVFSALKLFG
jgi:DNA-binding NarL/FixJ family response regulator